MAWTTPRTWVPGEVVTDTMLNEQVRDNELYLKAWSLVDLLTAQGDTIYASAPNTPVRLAKGGGSALYIMNVEGTAPTWLAKGTASQRLVMNSNATAPEWQSFPGCSVYHSANQSINNNTDVVLAFNSEAYDDDTMHDNATNNSRITIRTPGRYQFTAYCIWDTTPAATSIWLRKNGTDIIGRAGNAAGALESGVVMATINCVANDYVEVLVRQSAGAPHIVQALAGYSPIFVAQRIA